MSFVEQAKYTSVQTDTNVEIRDYAPALIAEVEIHDERSKALSEGFRLIADYIFGNNLESKKVAMTAPVLQEKSSNIAMTAPVSEQGDDKSWRVRFVMPGSYTLASLPKPKNPLVKIISLPAKRFVAIRFTGNPNNQDLQQNLEKLTTWIHSHHFKEIGKPVYAFYNPPWTLPFLRRNEVMIEIEKP